MSCLIILLRGADRELITWYPGSRGPRQHEQLTASAVKKKRECFTPLGAARLVAGEASVRFSLSISLSLF